MYSSKMGRANDLMLLLGLNETINLLAMASCVCFLVTCYGGRMAMS